MMAQPWLLDGVIVASFLALVGTVAGLIRTMRGSGAAVAAPEPDEAEGAATAKLLLADWERRFSERFPAGLADPLPLLEQERTVQYLSHMLCVRQSWIRSFYRDMGRFPVSAGDIRWWSISDIRLKRKVRP